MNKKKFRFNITDLIIILVLVAAISVLAYIFVFSDDTVIEGEAHTIRYVVEVSPVNEIFADAVKEGDKVALESDRNAVLGYVSAPPEVMQTLGAVYDEESGAEAYPEREGLVDVYVTFDAPTTKKEWGYESPADKTYLVVGRTIELFIGDMQCLATCIEMDIID